MKRGVLIFLSLMLATCAVGQTQSAPAAPAAPVSGSVQDQPSADSYEPTNQPLSGVKAQDIGTPSATRNTLIPTFTVSGGWDSNAPRLVSSGSDSGSGSAAFSGGLTLNRDNGRGNGTSLTYMGGEQIYTIDSALNSQFHRLIAEQSLVAGRWSFLVSDGFSYQKDAFATSPPMLFPGLYFGPGGTLFRPGVTPGESIIGQNTPRINNTSAGQVTYGFSRATTLTTSFSYGLLHYFDTNAYLSSRELSLGTGLDHKFGRNTLGVNYSYAKFSYDDIPVKFDTHTVQVMYSHVLTGRWSFEVGGGPTIIVSDYAFFNSKRVYGSGQAALHHHMPMLDWSVHYGRSVTSGSGGLPGAITDEVGVAASRKLGKSTTANLSGGYARNSGVFTNSSFNTFNVGAGISQSLGRYLTMSFGYTGQRQTASSNSGLTRHSVLVSLGWSFRPIRLQ
jgi:hypothetical protein